MTPNLQMPGVGLERIVPENAFSSHLWIPGLHAGRFLGWLFRVAARLRRCESEGCCMAIVPGASLSSEQAAFGDLLGGVPEEARTLLWQGFLQALDPVVSFWEQTPAGTRHALPPPVLEHWGERFDEAVLSRQALETMRRVWRIECALAADVLEALILEGNSAKYLPLLTACCTRIGQIYSEIKRRCGLLFAILTLRWELKLLGYRGSLVVAPLLFEEAGRAGYFTPITAAV
jgi:hypothetical protein